jgi:hypothetical protein
MGRQSMARRERGVLPTAPGLEPEPPYYRTDAPYRGRAPYFYDVERLPGVHRLRENWRTIRSEYEENVRRGTDHVVDVFNPAGPTVRGWRSVNFQTYLWRYHEACRAFPVSLALLEAIPGLTSAFINVLEPNSAIATHQGDSNTTIRCHLGLDVPPGDCGVRVGPETRRSGNGTLLGFCDAHAHASWNATGQRRVVLVFDVMLPEYRDRQRAICANVLAATAVIWLETQLRGLAPVLRPFRSALRRVLGAAFQLWLPIQRRRRDELAPLGARVVPTEPS